ncbi:MAG: CNNM domain-containing protein, partial [Oscillospiraceae bacterium]
MNNPIIWQIFLQVLLIALNAVFACAEIAVISMNDNKLAQMAAQGDKRAMRLARLTSQPARFLATIQVAITLS